MKAKLKNTKKKYSVFPPIRCSEEDKALVADKAKKAGMSLSKYMRLRALEYDIVVNDNSQSQLEYAFLKHLKTDIGTPLNTIAHRANKTGELPRNLENILHALELCLDHLVFSVKLFDEQKEENKVICPFEFGLEYQLNRIGNNLFQLMNIAQLRDIKPGILLRCWEKTSYLLDRILASLKLSDHGTTGL
jgi:hypothetical protein